MVGACESDALKTLKTQIQYIDKFVGVVVTMQRQVPTTPVRGTTDACDPDVQKAVKLSQVQHTERIIDVRAVIQHQAAIRTVQEKAEVPQSRQLYRGGRRGCGDTADAFETKSEREASEAQV